MPIHNTTNTELSQAAASGLASITAIAAIGNARAVPNSKKVILDSQIYVGSDNCESLIGAVSYINKSNMDFDDVGIYLIITTVCSNF
jgi:hypothetical protein